MRWVHPFLAARRCRRRRYLAHWQPVHAYDFEGTHYDLGDKLGFLK
ncbi:hypothetical protein [Mitsuokella multacida]|nr:hypothetical protein [Mitsuokella multacida]